MHIAMAISGHARVAAAVERTSAYVVEQRREQPRINPLSDNFRTTDATTSAVRSAGA